MDTVNCIAVVKQGERLANGVGIKLLLTGESP